MSKNHGTLLNCNHVSIFFKCSKVQTRHYTDNHPSVTANGARESEGGRSPESFLEWNAIQPQNNAKGNMQKMYFWTLGKVMVTYMSNYYVVPLKPILYVNCK